LGRYAALSGKRDEGCGTLPQHAAKFRRLAFLLPDMLNGFGYLEAVKSVIVDGKYDKYQ
jgi:hypothetical protein